MDETELTVRGWVGGDVELRRTSTGDAYASFRVACTPRRWRDGAWHDGSTVWHTVKVWRALAENTAACVRSGDPVVVHGRLVADPWRRPDGTTSVRHVLVAQAVGHDLARGRAVFTRTGAGTAGVQEPAAPAVAQERLDAA